MRKGWTVWAIGVSLGGVALGMVGSAQAETSFVFLLQPSQEVPPTPSQASGVCVATLNDAQDALSVTCTHNVQNVTAAHIHRAPRGVNGGVIFPFPNAASPITGTWMNLTPQDVQDLMAAGLYVNVHSTAFPGGEIRGQIIRGLTSFAFGADGSQENPPTPSQASGECVGVIAVDESAFDLRCEHTVQSPTAAHIHRAPRGVNGGVIFPLGDPASPIERTWDNPGAQNLADMRAEGLYVNIHTAAFPGGEIRGQIVHDGECTDRQRLKTKCKNGKLTARVYKAAAGSVVVVCNDGADCITTTASNKGKAKEKFMQQVEGDHLVTAHFACGIVTGNAVRCR